MLFQYISDIHLEFSNIHELEIKLKKSAPFLILAGDIGDPFSDSYNDFIQFVSSNYEKVFVIAGNHEYYQKNNKISFNNVNKQINNIVNNYNNVFFLNNTTYTFNYNNTNYKLIGSTLWSYIDDNNYYATLKYINDYKNIYDNDNGNNLITPEFTNNLYKNNVEFIKKEIDNNLLDTKLIVITHHLPSFKLINKKYITNPLNCVFASHLDNLIKKPVNAWICGHTHYYINIEINGVICSINPVGYKNENTEFKNDAIINI